MASYEKRGNRWRVIWHEDGRRHTKSGFASKEDAEDWHDKERSKTKLFGTPQEPNVTLADYSVRWLRYCKAEGLEASTRERYKSELVSYIVPEAGRIPIRDLTTPMLVALVKNRKILPRIHRVGPNRGQPLDQQPPDVGQPASAGTKNKTSTVLQAMFRDAVLLGYRVDNPAAALRHKGTGAKRQDGIPTLVEYHALLEQLKQQVYADYLEFIRLTGLRPSELVALRWRHVYLASATIKVRAAAPEPNGKPVWKDYGKTPRSRRTVPINAQLRPTIDRLFAEAGDRAYDDSGDTFDSNDWVMVGVTGSRLRISTANTALSKARKAKLEANPTMRDFDAYAHRHMFASACIAAGLQPKRIQTYMGHRSIQTTYDTYGHLWESQDPEAVRQLDDFLADEERRRVG